MRTMAACAALVFGASLAHAGPVPAPGLERVDRSYPSEVLRLSAMHRVKFHLKLHPSCDALGAMFVKFVKRAFCRTRNDPSNKTQLPPREVFQRPTPSNGSQITSDDTNTMKPITYQSRKSFSPRCSTPVPGF